MSLERLSEIDQMVAQAVSAVESDQNSSPALDAVVKEFGRKSQKALGLIEDGSAEEIRIVVVELEQAGDSARAAAEAELGLQNDTLQAVIDAHKATNVFKSDILVSSSVCSPNSGAPF